MELNSMEELLVHEMMDIYDGERQLMKALPKMAKAASAQKLQAAFNKHLKQTEQQIQRLEKALNELGIKPNGESCEGMKGLIAEGEKIIETEGDDSVRDAALIGAAQRVEHYEIAAYGTARALAECLGHKSVAKMLQSTLKEEGSTDKLLSQIAERSVNAKAATKH